MNRILQKLFKKTTENPVIAAGFKGKAETIKGVAAADEGEVAYGEYEEFCATFAHKPGVNFNDFIHSHQIDRLTKWMQPQTAEPEPKAFIRLMLETNKQGMNLWDEDGVVMYLKKRTLHGGGPSPESAACLSLLAQVVEKPITYYYPDPKSDQVKVLEFSHQR